MGRYIMQKGDIQEKILQFSFVTGEFQMINLMNCIHLSHQNQYECKSILIKDILIQDAIKTDYDRWLNYQRASPSSLKSEKKTDLNDKT